MITNSSASVISNNLYDLFGVKRYEQGSAQTPWMWKIRQVGEESMLLSKGGTRSYLPWVAVASAPDWVYWGCVVGCLMQGHSWEYCLKECAKVPPIPPAPKPQPPQPEPPKNPCPPGACPFKCPGAKEIGCGYPGTTISCPDGTQIPLPKDCAGQSEPPKQPPGQSARPTITIRPWCSDGGWGIAVCGSF